MSSKTDVKPFVKKCFICQSDKHLRNNCPNKPVQKGAQVNCTGVFDDSDDVDHSDLLANACVTVDKVNSCKPESVLPKFKPTPLQFIDVVINDNK